MEFLELVRQRKEHLVARYRDAKSVRLQWLKDELRVRLSEVDALLTEVADPARLGSTLGVHALGAFGAGVVSPVLFGAVLDFVGREHTAAWGLAFGTAGVGAVVAIVAMAWLRAQGGATGRPIA